MKTRLICAAFIMLLTSWKPVTAQSSDGDWEVIFNGKDFTGWKKLNGNHKIEVKDGMIVATTVPGEPNGFLCTEKEYGDFILELEVSIDTTMNNSGIQFRSLSYPGYQNGRVHGYQMEVDPKPQRWSGSIYDEARRGWLYTTELNPSSKTAFRNNQWNHYRIECFGTSNRTWVNGVPVSHLIDNETLRGFVGLQVHSNNPNDPIPPGDHQIRFKNIKIQTTNLKPSPPDDVFIVNLIPNNLSEQEKQRGYKLLWDGKTANGLTLPGKSKLENRGWEIKDGELSIVNNTNQGLTDNKDIFISNSNAAFELSFDFKLSDGAESGIVYLLPKPEASDALKFQIQDDTKPSEANKGNDMATLASLFGIKQSQQTMWTKRKAGVWNHAMIRVYPDRRVEHWLNQFKMLDYQSKDSRKGYLMLENKGSKVSYRSIKIKELH